LTILALVFKWIHSFAHLLLRELSGAGETYWITGLAGHIGTGNADIRLTEFAQSTPTEFIAVKLDAARP